MSGLIMRVGDATYPNATGPVLIAHACNDIGAWGAGFTRSLSLRWPNIEQFYSNWYNYNKSKNVGTVTGPFMLGENQYVELAPGWVLANMVAQHGLYSRTNPIPLDMIALEICLRKLGDSVLAAHSINRYTVHMPKIGAGLARGNWDEISKLLEKQLVERGVNVTVYTLP